jgi:uncharacterized membrane protein YbhN (UPF0104 family)
MTNAGTLEAPLAVRPRARRRLGAPVRALARHLVVLGILALAVHVLLPRLASAGTTVGAVGRFQWIWVSAVGAAAVMTYAMAALSLTAASGRALAFRRTVAAQLAAAFTNRLAPAGIGAMATNVRYLEATGMTRAGAVTAVGLDSIAGFVVHVVALGAVAAAFATSHQHFAIHRPDVPDNWLLLVVMTTLLSAIGIGVCLVRFREPVGTALRRALAQTTTLVHQPRRAVRLLGASAGITTAYALAFMAAVHAAGGGPSLVSVVAVYLGGSALAAAAPTPGGLGALEAGLIAGLTSVGQPAAAAVTAVLVFRLVTYWVPVLPGAASFWALRRAGSL